MNSGCPYPRRLGVLLFLMLLLMIFELAELRSHFTLDGLHQKRVEPIIGLAVFILIFAPGNLVRIPGWIFMAAAVLARGRTWGGLATYLAARMANSKHTF